MTSRASPPTGNECMDVGQHIGDKKNLINSSAEEGANVRWSSFPRDVRKSKMFPMHLDCCIPAALSSVLPRSLKIHKYSVNENYGQGNKLLQEYIVIGNNCFRGFIQVSIVVNKKYCHES